MDRPEVKVFAYEYGLDYEKDSLVLDVKDKRIVFPIKHKGLIVDAVGRSTSIFVRPKWKRYGNSNVPFYVG